MKMITKEQQILDILKPLFPDGLTRQQIITKLQIKTSTFRRYLKKLRQKNQIFTLRVAQRHWLYYYKAPGVTLTDIGNPPVIKTQSYSSNNHRLPHYAHLNQLGTTIGSDVYQPIQKKHQYTYLTQTHTCGYCHTIIKHITKTNQFAKHLAKCRQQAYLAQQREYYQQLKESYSYVQ